jgi:nucleoside-diphosphate-sugar epimerase
MGILTGLARCEVPLKEDPRFGGRPATLYPEASAAKLRAACGWEPAIPLEDTLAGLLDHWRSR